jgi:hypothetical protein
VLNREWTEPDPITSGRSHGRVVRAGRHGFLGSFLVYADVAAFRRPELRQGPTVSTGRSQVASNR